MPDPEGGQDAQVHPSHRRAFPWSARTVRGHRPRCHACQDAQLGRHPPPAGIPRARSVRASRRPGVEPAALRKQRLGLLPGPGTAHLRPFFSPLFTGVRGREILRTSPRGGSPKLPCARLGELGTGVSEGTEVPRNGPMGAIRWAPRLRSTPREGIPGDYRKKASKRHPAPAR